MHLRSKKQFFFLQIKKYQKLNQIFKIQETKLWKVSLKSVCISRQRSFISKKKEEGWNDGKGRGRPGLSGAVSISISCISSHISRAEVNFFRVDTSNKAFQIYFRREKGEEDVSRVVSSPVHTDNWVVRESFIVQGARLFIPFHSISLHRIPSFDRKRRENDGSQMPPTFFLLFYSHIFIYFLLVYFFFVSIWSIVAILVEDATRWSEQSGNAADLGRHMQQPSHARLSILYI